ncbi:MAG: hypothetical protein Q9207_004652 [Kuettlingeria erythrocarpa]
MKLCAIYDTVDILIGFELAEYLWAKWFQPGHASPSHPQPRRLQVQATDRYHRVDNPYEDHENYKLETLFHAIFVVIDTRPPLKNFHTSAGKDLEFLGATPVLLVRTGEFHNMRTGPIDFAPIVSLSEEVDGNADVRRISMGDAVDFILDLHRRNCDGHSWALD